MKFILTLSVLLSLSLFLESCELIGVVEGSKIEVYEGYILDYWSGEPIDSVEVWGCTRNFGLFSHNDCRVQTLTDSNGYFHLEVEVAHNSSSSISLQKITYRNLDDYFGSENCEIQPDGTYICYLVPNRTKLIIDHTARYQPLTYDSLVIEVSTVEDVFTYYYNNQTTESNLQTLYFWAKHPRYEYELSTRVNIPDNSFFYLKADYYDSSNVVLTDYDTVYLRERHSYYYDILD